MDTKKCLICGNTITADVDDDQICDACEETRNELSNGKGDGGDE